MSDGEIEVEATFSVKKTMGKPAACATLKKYKYAPFGSEGDCGVGRNYAKRSALIGALKEGTLVIEVQMKQTETTTQSVPFVPENPLCKNILNKFMDEESADVIFEVGSEQARDNARGKRLKMTSMTFYAHRLILQECTSALGELCKPKEDSTPIPITDVKSSSVTLPPYA